MDTLDAKDPDTLYEQDFVTWTERQAALLKEGRLDLVDVANLAEEIESLGRSQISALRSSYKLIAMHLLKLMKQPEKATPSRENTINRERGNVIDLLDENPGMRPKRSELFAKAYVSARSDAAFETQIDLEHFPEEPPFSLEQIESKAFWPPGFPRPR
ncbi:DUF29 domain-containing protein [Beijerinckia sp. L45]|uniref:DUF29 domain-containing protein n=1 Tax=Beijerinckia sp. L45 TaxID=1641855 RepID=UPI00131B71E8|nr:DUF29 domain-containing protein [Beijerinckia sp. L45]